jgi:predicted O-methyltransferase YrrM
MDDRQSDKQILGRLEAIQQATRAHRRSHGCLAYTFEDGRGLIDLVHSIRPKRVLELGTALGFTACCLAQGHPSATVDTIEVDEIHVKLAEKHIQDVGLSAKVQVHQGLFEDILPSLTPGYDAVFFDGFAPSMPVLEKVRAMLREGGVLICANTGLADGEERRRILNYLNNTQLWQSRDSLENNQTKVCVKL